MASSLRLLKLMAAVLRCLKKHCLRRQNKKKLRGLSPRANYTITKLSGVSGTGSPTPRGTGRIADGIFRYTSVDFFFHGHNILNRGHHTEISQYCDC